MNSVHFMVSGLKVKVTVTLNVRVGAELFYKHLLLNPLLTFHSLMYHAFNPHITQTKQVKQAVHNVLEWTYVYCTNRVINKHDYHNCVSTMAVIIC